MTQKTALITGATRGLGAALAEALAPEYHIIAVGRTVGALEELDDRIKAKGGNATLAPMNVTDTGAMQTLCRGIHDRWGTLDMWFHTAIHVAPLTPSHQIDTKDLEKSITSNITATAMLINYVAPLLKEDGNAVFFEDPIVGDKFYGSYGSTKAAQIALVQSWQKETSRIGPHVDILTPQPMPTATRARFFPGEDRDTLTDIHTEAARLLATLQK
ncbi:SDR family NAD(P)-dependent oxidoreductase [Sulfitobacter donghicola]|uniref:Oxidoreductase n=1 Tax=Sulfitobacter donghicola DSW-25 = KCTC 12864 = JCM 14565 TaxID=1300350 RepID=A0A073II42_9RHOB|nr:SDR family NAD(P)-dependent oxidoreductase [Sulfitobacter donghicola]KEJ89459.1 oxidoreductase [Sulfitobacter donghicola DSW-25 = KCTC 12864 = JCM 14565]KIN69279.1 Oxidoreductase [Sulfitobacter donghicola DSW-25 = KCTC 12864 = JCM 14565]